MDCFLGVDVGSSTTKLVLIYDGKMIGHRVVQTGVECEDTAQGSLKILLRENDIDRQDIRYIVSTGYGRRLMGFADDSISEITANVKGAVWLMDQLGHGMPGTIINIGGQDSKVISIDKDGMTDNFAMNDKCAAGTGRFLETVSRILEIDISELGEFSCQAAMPLKINSTCAVFAESEIISLLARKKNKSDIIAGAHDSIARRIGKMVKGVGLRNTIFFDGGPAVNKGMVYALEEELGSDVFVPHVPQITTALGAALLAKERYS